MREKKDMLKLLLQNNLELQTQNHQPPRCKRGGVTTSRLQRRANRLAFVMQLFKT